MAIALKIEIKHDNYSNGGPRNGIEMSYRFLVDNTTQIGWIVEQFIKVLNTEEWRKMKAPRSSGNRKIEQVL